MINITLGEWFSLPPIEKNIFNILKSLNVKYNQKNGFLVTEKTNIKKLNIMLENSLNQKITFFFKCFICNSNSELNSKFYSVLKTYSTNNICQSCLNNPKSYLIYSIKFVELLNL